MTGGIAKKGLFLILVFILVSTYTEALSSEYFSIEEYNKSHPEQVEIGKSFSKIVNSASIPIPAGLQKKTITISFIYPGDQASDYWRRSILSFRARMDELKLDYTLKEYFSKPVVDYRVQEGHIRSALNEKPDYLVFTLDVKKHRRIIERIIIKQSPKLILQNITTPLKSWEGKQPFLYVGFDHANGSQMIADYLISKTNSKGHYAMLYFSRGYVSEMRGDTLIEYLQQKSDLKLVSSYYTDGDRNKSTHAVRQIMSEHPDIKFIYSCSTDVALGAIDALSAPAGPRTVFINGWGGGSSELAEIEHGSMDVTVMRMNDDNGVAMAEAIKLDIGGRGSQVPLVFSGDFALIEKGMSKDKIEGYKKRAFRYSGTY